jgi:hypothetical protein
VRKKSAASKLWGTMGTIEPDKSHMVKEEELERSNNSENHNKNNNNNKSVNNEITSNGVSKPER